MKNKIMQIIHDNTETDRYKNNTIANISQCMEIPKSEVLNQIQSLFRLKKIIKINENPIYFVDREIFEKKYGIIVKETEIDDMSCFLSASKKEPQDFEKLIGYNGSLARLVEQCKATISYPPQGLPMMLHGSTGTGKSLIAKLTYEYALNHGLLTNEKRFVSVNCSEYANNPELLTANLFGYVKGAFTGADKDTSGLIELANGGVLFLDEVHNLRGECQEKLFQFMDQSIYHRVGNNKTWYKSQVRLIFATTENPEKILLKTLQRRIPMTIEVPSLEGRGLQEKIQILYHIFNLEQKRLKLKIKMSSQVYNLLISHKYSGNIGGLKSIIQSCCVNSLFQVVGNKEMEITLKNVPEVMLEKTRIEKIEKYHIDSYVYVDELLNIFKANDFSICLCEEILKEYEKFISTRNLNKFINDSSLKILNYLDTVLTKSFFEKKSEFYKEGICHILQMVSKQYHLELTNNNMLSISSLFWNFMEDAPLISEWSLKHKKEINEILSILKEDSYRQYSISFEILKYLENYLDMKIADVELMIVILLLYSFDNTSHRGSRRSVILAHGFSTASSIAATANQFLEKYIFDSIDMPLNLDSNAIIKQLNVYVNKLGNVEELILLVDMGSLEEIYKGLNLKNTNIGIINQVTTSIALEIGTSIIQNETMEKIFEKVAKMGEIKYRIENHRQKKPVILCSCMSGMGVAERLKEVILNSLPTGTKIQVVTYNYNNLLNEEMNQELFHNNRILCVIGTMNPNVTGLNFVAIEDLVINSDSHCFDEYFKECLSKDDLESFKKNIVKNFSLTNIMNTLTILNPNKLLEHVAEALDKLQNRNGIRLSNKICLGLYIHVSCLIERLVLNQKIEIYPNIECFKMEQSKFIENVKISFKDVENYYKVDIPVEEIGYIYDYICFQDINNESHSF